jgi:hypothetical protein
MFLRLGLFLWAGVVAIPIRPDACAAIAGETFSKPADALACLRSFSFNDTLRQNVLSTVSRVLDFCTFEDYYPKSSFPFPTKVDIRAELARINSTPYVVSLCGYFIVDSTDTFHRRTMTSTLTCIILSTK